MAKGTTSTQRVCITYLLPFVESRERKPPSSARRKRCGFVPPHEARKARTPLRGERGERSGVRSTGTSGQGDERGCETKKGERYFSEEAVACLRENKSLPSSWCRRSMVSGLLPYGRQRRVEGGARAHGRVGLLLVGQVVAAYVHGRALRRVELIDYLLLVL